MFVPTLPAGYQEVFRGLTIQVLEGHCFGTSGHFNGRLPSKNCRCWPVVAFSITCLFICPPPTSTYNSHTLQLFNVETPVLDMTGHLGTWYQLAKMARVTPRLGNGPRFGTCSVLFHNIGQIFSVQLSFHWFPAYVCTSEGF